jgi:hypothetical protein
VSRQNDALTMPQGEKGLTQADHERIGGFRLGEALDLDPDQLTIRMSQRKVYPFLGFENDKVRVPRYQEGIPFRLRPP